MQTVLVCGADAFCKAYPGPALPRCMSSHVGPDTHATYIQVRAVRGSNQSMQGHCTLYTSEYWPLMLNVFDSAVPP
jgi:hypothetical protein